ncbi:MAG: ACP S-malonyltransferase [Acetivibrionales bacterium]|jgi:[acyl-carrier-protein] S-malonyltransferase
MSRIGLLFPGQGSQATGMGQDLYNLMPSAKKIMDDANDILGFDIRGMIFNGVLEELTRTENAQPAIFIVSAMYFEKYKELDIPFEIVAGHSLGEYSALYAADVFGFEEGLRLVRKRALAMESILEKGAMFAIMGMPLEQIEDGLKEYDGKVVIANINSKSQIVISGYEEETTQAASDFSKVNDTQVRQLNVSTAFHSPLMQEAEKTMATEIDKIEFNDPTCFVIPNFTATPSKDINEIKDALKKQITGRVNWLDTILSIKNMGIEQLYEVGYGDVLRKLNKAITLRPKCLSL